MSSACSPSWLNIWLSCDSRTLLIIVQSLQSRFTLLSGSNSGGHHYGGKPNSVTQGRISPYCCSLIIDQAKPDLDETGISAQGLHAVFFVVKCLNKQTYLPPSLLFLPHSFLAVCLGTVLPSLFFMGATSICHCRCVFLCLLSTSLITVTLQLCKFLPSFRSLCLFFSLRCLLIKANSSLVAFQTNCTYLTLSQNITTDSKYLAPTEAYLFQSKQLNGILQCLPVHLL